MAPRKDGVLIGKPRGKKGTFPVYIYSAEKRAKVYVGCRPTYKEAQTLLGDKLREIANQPAASPVPAGFTIASYAARFLEVHHTVAKRRGEPTTKIQNRSMLKQFLELHGDRPLTAFSKAEANDWASQKPSSAKVVKAMFAEAFREDAVTVDPFARVQFPKQRGRMDIDPLTEGEIEKLCELAVKAGGTYAPELWALVMFAAWTGMRPGEVCALNFAEVDLETDTIRVEWNMRNDGSRGPVKMKERREIVIAPKAREALLSLPRRDGQVFRSPTDKPLRPNSLRRNWMPVRDSFTAHLPESHWLKRRLLVDPDDKLDFYELRHYCGSILADRGASGQEIAEHLGNTPSVCERVYIHPHRSRIQKRLRAAFALADPDESVGSKSGEQAHA